MKTNLARYAIGLLLFGGVIAARAQSTWNYFISDAGGGNSLVTWTVAGDLATPPGSVLVTHVSTLAISINAPGIFADPFVGSGTPQSIPTPDGSYFQLGTFSVYTSILAYQANNAAGSGNDTFGILAPILPPHEGDPGMVWLYNPGTQSALLPIDYSSLNPGTYQSQGAGFNMLTVNLTVGPVPEPSVLALCVVGGVCWTVRFAGRSRVG